MENNTEQIKKLVKEKIKIKKIKSINLINDGYTNFVYQLIDDKKNKYLIKISKNNEPILTNEQKIYNQYNSKDLIYSDDNGTLIKKWVEGSDFNLDKNNINRLKLLCNEIKKFHSIKFNLKEFEHFDYSEYAEWLAKKNKYFELYNFAIKNNSNARLVLCHGDINNKNVILYTKNKKECVCLIDFEWSCINYEWFDYINYLAEQEIYDENILEVLIDQKIFNSIQNIYLLLFVRWYYCLAWASLSTNIDNIEQYKKRAKEQVKKLYKKIIQNKWYIPVKRFNLKF